MDSRRDALKKIALSVAAVGVAGAGDAMASLPKAFPEPAVEAAAPPAPEPAPAWTLVAPLGAGAALGLGWSLRDLEPLRAGAVVLALAHEAGGEARVHLCARGADPAGLARTLRFDLLLMNQGDGRTQSQEELGRVVLGLAGRVAANEDAAFLAHPELAGLMAHAERLAAFGADAHLL